MTIIFPDTFRNCPPFKCFVRFGGKTDVIIDNIMSTRPCMFTPSPPSVHVLTYYACEPLYDGHMCQSKQKHPKRAVEITIHHYTTFPGLVMGKKVGN